MCCDGLVEKLPQVDSCCCCCRVETGSKIIAWLGTIGAFIATIAVIVGVVGLAQQNKELDPAKFPNKDSLLTVGILVGVFLIIYLLSFWAMALLLLVGIYTEDMSKVRLWLRVNICLFIFGIVGNVFKIISLCTTSNQQPGTIPTAIISTIIQILLTLYFLSVVKSHHQNMTQGLQTMRA